jgi:hypothetical protein
MFEGHHLKGLCCNSTASGMKERTMKVSIQYGVICLFCFLLLLAGCGSNETTVATAHAAQPVSISCPGMIVGSSTDGGQLGVGTGVCTITGQGSGEYKMSAVLSQNVQAVWEEAWIGTLVNQKLEVSAELSITTPDGRSRLLLNEFDKHSDQRGDSLRTWPLVLNMPKGTVLESKIRFNSISPCPCSVEASWTFNGNLQ